jgi:DNA-binding transcriptional LysR family regulator
MMRRPMSKRPLRPPPAVRPSRPSRPSRTDASLGDLAALALFAQVVDARSFTAAARRSGTTTSAVSKRVAGLERRLGVRLLERTTRRAAPTEAGLVLYDRCKHLLAEAADAQEAVAAFRGQLAGTLRVSTAVTLGQMHIVPLVIRFLTAHPELRIALSLSDRSVDLVADGIDVAIRSGRPADSSLMSRKVAPDRRVVCATPAYFERHSVPCAPVDLRDHQCLRHPLMLPAGGWAFVTPEGPVTVPVAGALEVDNVSALREATLAGLGVALLPHYAVVADLRARRLVAVLDRFLPEPSPFRALWVAGKNPATRVQTFVAFLAKELPRRL